MRGGEIFVSNRNPDRRYIRRRHELRMKLMILRILPVFVAVIALTGLSACHRNPDGAGVATPSPMPESQAKSQEAVRLADAVNAYAREQNAENDAAVRKAMADLDSEKTVLEDLVAKRHGRERQKVAARLLRLNADLSEETTRFSWTILTVAGTLMALKSNGPSSHTCSSSEYSGPLAFASSSIARQR
jgi:hypothetical protein